MTIPAMSSTAVSILLTTFLIVALLAVLPRIIRVAGRRLQVGNRVRLHGGHQEPPPWLQGRDEIRGQVTALVLRDERDRYEVALDSPLEWNGTTYSFALMQLRFKSARWLQSGIVALELWVSAPSLSAEGAPEARHEYVESHAAYKVIERSSPASR